MKKHFKNTVLMSALVSGALLTGFAQAGMDMQAKVWAENQAVSDGTVTAKKVNAEANGWLVVHRTDEAMKPGPVVGYAPLKKGANMDVTAILQENVK